MDQYETIYGRLEKLIPDLAELRAGDARKSKSGGFMDLNLDVLSKNTESVTIALSHYFEMGGDQVADPDMEIRVYTIKGWERAEALTFQDQFGYKMVYPKPGYVNPRVKKELNSFLSQWLKNCLDQGHRLAKGED